jgi:hypothetical protein
LVSGFVSGSGGASGMAGIDRVAKGSALTGGAIISGMLSSFRGDRSLRA